MHTRVAAFIGIMGILVLPFAAVAQTAALTERLRGHVLLQVEGRGEAWYVDKVLASRHYLRDGVAAYEVMRRLGLGISEPDFARFSAGDETLRARLVGRIVLRVHLHGEAYYLCPRTGALSYLRDGAAAFTVMRECGLGITDADLSAIPISTVSALPPGTTPIPAPAPSTAPAPVYPAPGGAPTLSGTGPVVAGCEIFPGNNPWNQDISALPVHANSAAYVAAIGADMGLHPDFGATPDYGIPYNVVDGATPRANVTFDDYGDESDAGPYPLPLRPEIEAGSDQHLLSLHRDECKLYELFNTALNTDRGMGWVASSGAIWDLRSNALRHENWTSADAAGLPIFPGLVKYEEVAAGEIRHAIRFTAPRTQAGHIHPATHHAGTADATLPPMGLRLRLKASYDISNLSGAARVIAIAMQKYGIILADNGSPWYFQGAYDAGWNDDELNQLKAVPGSAFEAVETGPIVK